MWDFQNQFLLLLLSRDAENEERPFQTYGTEENLRGSEVKNQRKKEELSHN